MPAFTSSMWAPASTWAIASRSTRLKSPAFISAARSFRPVGLMRSPMIVNGRSKPMTTSRPGELTTVWAIDGRMITAVTGGLRSQALSLAARGDQPVQHVLRIRRLDALHLGLGERHEIVAIDGALASPHLL